MAHSAMKFHSISPGTVSTAINTSNYQYDVFLNHRGCDTKNNFTGHLYKALRSRGIRVFLDKEELQAGEDFSVEIEAVIKNTAVHLAIFSENYANSYWCLNELVLMVDSGAIIIPVFFKNVEPDHLQGITESRENEQNGNRADRESEFARGFSSLKNMMKDNGRWQYELQTIRKWREALLKVSNKSGFELKACNGYEAELLEKIVQNVLKRLNRSPFYVPKYEVGLDEKVEDFRKKVLSQQQQNENPRVVGIVGFGGVGKTTLAKKFFQIESPGYRYCCFCPVSGNECPLHTLFGELMPHLDSSPNSVSVVKNRLMSNPSVAMTQNNPSLVVLDGVDNVEMRKELLEIQVLLHSRSLILITSRDPEVLKCSEVEAIYNLDGLNTPCSQKLFCFHAFHEATPLQGYEYLVAWFLGVCNGSPLLLKLLGSLLSGNKDRFSWEDLLDRFQQKHYDKIQKKLKVIYHKLGTEEQQNFLYIACNFVGKSIDTWKGSRRKGIWFQILLEKRLVEVDSKNCIQMHDLLQDFGKKIAEESPLLLEYNFQLPRQRTVEAAVNSAGVRQGGRLE